MPRPRMCSVAKLIVRIDADDVDRAHPFMECVQGDRDEADRTAVRYRDEHIPFIVRAGRSHRVSLIFPPVWMQPQEDAVA